MTGLMPIEWERVPCASTEAHKSHIHHRTKVCPGLRADTVSPSEQRDWLWRHRRENEGA